MTRTPYTAKSIEEDDLHNRLIASLEDAAAKYDDVAWLSLEDLKELIDERELLAGTAVRTQREIEKLRADKNRPPYYANGMETVLMRVLGCLGWRNE